MVLKCPACGGRIDLKTPAPGLRVQCPVCLKTFRFKGGSSAPHANALPPVPRVPEDPQELRSEPREGTAGGDTRILKLVIGGAVVVIVLVIATVVISGTLKSRRTQAELARLNTLVDRTGEEVNGLLGKMRFDNARGALSGIRPEIDGAKAGREELENRYASISNRIGVAEEEHKRRVAEGWEVFEGRLTSPQEKQRIMGERKAAEEQKLAEVQRQKQEQERAEASRVAAIMPKVREILTRSWLDPSSLSTRLQSAVKQEMLSDVQFHEVFLAALEECYVAKLDGLVRKGGAFLSKAGLEGLGQADSTPFIDAYKAVYGSDPPREALERVKQGHEAVCARSKRAYEEMMRPYPPGLLLLRGILMEKIKRGDETPLAGTLPLIAERNLRQVRVTATEQLADLEKERKPTESEEDILGPFSDCIRDMRLAPSLVDERFYPSAANCNWIAPFLVALKDASAAESNPAAKKIFSALIAEVQHDTDLYETVVQDGLLALNIPAGRRLTHKEWLRPVVIEVYSNLDSRPRLSERPHGGRMLEKFQWVLRRYEATVESVIAKRLCQQWDRVIAQNVVEHDKWDVKQGKLKAEWDVKQAKVQAEMKAQAAAEELEMQMRRQASPSGQRQATCPRCSGTGTVAPRATDAGRFNKILVPSRCPVCGGRGSVPQ
jgi:hypothetical protein